MTGISTWSTSAASNNAAPPNGAPEGMTPGSVNDVIREVMAQVRTWLIDAQWLPMGHTPTYVGATQFKVATDMTTTYYAVGRRVKAIGSTPFTIYGTISASSYSAPDTTVTVTWDSGSLNNTLTAVYPNIIDGNGPIGADLLALEALASTGHVVRTAANTYALRTITGTADKITVTDGNGVAGNPTLTIAATYIGQNTITTLGTITTGVWTGTDIAVADGGTGASDASGARTNLGLVIGTNVQAYHANLAAFAGLTLAANKLPYGNGAGTLAVTDYTASARTFDALAAVQGDILYASAADTWTKLAKGTASQQLRMNAGATAPEWATISSSGATYGTKVTTTSGTVAEWTNAEIASAKKIDFNFNVFSTNGTSDLIIQLGTSGGYVSSGYSGGSANAVGSILNSAGFIIHANPAAAETMSGAATMTKLSASDDVWAIHGVLCRNTTAGTITHEYFGGSVTLGGGLTKVQVTATNGTDTFDAGSMNILIS